jgi:ABC-type nitrate/sulfonate/bicarbonate transport system substrate-binding protein
MREVSPKVMFKVQRSGLEVAERKMLIPFFTRCACGTTLSIAVLAIVSHASAQPGTRVRIGLAGRNFSFLPFFVAEQEKFFEQEGIRAEMIYMRSPVAIPALSAGEIQYTTHFASVVRSAVKGFPVRVILSTSDRQMFSLVAAKSIRSIEDLRGKAVAVSNPLGIRVRHAADLEKIRPGSGKGSSLSLFGRRVSVG